MAPGWPYTIHYVFDAPLTNATSAKSVILSRDRADVRLPLHRPPIRTKGALNRSTYLIQVYRLDEEMWRAHGASHIFMYYHSSTHNVRQVLRHYEREGFVTVISWPLLPRFSNIDPNLSVYRLAHSLAHNDCVQRINSEFGALVDIDELIVP
ncbi:hypothetical protein OSTOST_03098, partial [Ostertagia ostertagi]